MKKLNIMLEDEFLTRLSDAIPTSRQKRFTISSINRRSVKKKFAISLLALVGVLGFAMDSGAVLYVTGAVTEPSSGTWLEGGNTYVDLFTVRLGAGDNNTYNNVELLPSATVLTANGGEDTLTIGNGSPTGGTTISPANPQANYLVPFTTGPDDMDGDPAVFNVNLYAYAAPGQSFPGLSVQITTVDTPEPSTLALVGVGAIGLLPYARRLRSAKS